ncbi:MAG: CoA transferase [Solirubrobacterales bacterium]|nr:CoA transferase [Solirubrobacterales bacterium]
MAGAHDNLGVLALSRVLAGPFAPMMLADLGAEVTKVERPGTGDDTRGWGPPFDDGGRATYFLAANRNKRSVVLDFGDPGDLAEVRRLAAAADVLVENFRPGFLDGIGLGYDDLRRENPGLVYCSISGFGRDLGSALPGYDMLVQALGGLMSITGEPGGEPQKVGVALVDVLAGLFATVGILAALRHRESTGEGQRVDIELLTSLLAALVNQASAFTAAGVVPQRMGNMHPSIAPYEVLAARDGHLVVAVGNDRQFANLCEVLGAAGLASEERFASNPARVEHRAELRAELEALLAADDASAWAAALTAARVPAGTINDIAQAFGLARELGLEPTTTLRREDGVDVELPRNPIGLSATPPSYRLAPPLMPGVAGSSGDDDQHRGDEHVQRRQR